MKQVFQSLLLVHLFTLFACYTTLAPEKPAKYIPLRTDFVMPPHHRPIETFYLREGLGKKPFTEMALIAVNIKGNVSEEYLLQCAQIQAQNIGADGIFVLNKEEYFQYLDGDVWVQPYTNSSTMRAIAFVYDENLVYAKKPDIQAAQTEKDSFRLHEEPYTPIGDGKFIKVSKPAQINLYKSPRVDPEQIAIVASDFEPMELLEKTDVVIYNDKKTLKSYFFKVRYKGTEAFVSGFDVRRR